MVSGDDEIARPGAARTAVLQDTKAADGTGDSGVRCIGAAAGIVAVAQIVGGGSAAGSQLDATIDAERGGIGCLAVVVDQEEAAQRP